jgi:hypothetical protein
MAKVYRAMKASGDGYPETGSSARTLGVRPSDLPIVDGVVKPGTGGMSVSPSLPTLPPQWVPKRLAHLREGAIGPDSNRVWSHGIGPFVAGEIAPHLLLRPDSATHGLVEPSREMPFDGYQAAIHSTRMDWRMDEAP